MYLNQNAKLGMPFIEKGNGLRFVNNSGGTISKGQVAAIDKSTTTAANIKKTVIATGSSNIFDPVVIAAADVASGAEGLFYSSGEVDALVATSVTSPGAVVCAGTANATGGNSLIASGTTNRNSCGFCLNQSSQGATSLTRIVFAGHNPPLNA